MKLPRYRNCFVCGMDNPNGLHAEPELENNAVVIRFTAFPQYCGFQAWLHGGIIASLMDEAMFWAAAVGLQRIVATAGLSVRYHRPVPIGSTVKVSAQLKERRQRLCLTIASLSDADGQLYASAEGQYVAIQKEGQPTGVFFPDDETAQSWDLSRFHIEPLERGESG
ncbi:MAG: PaaI family thioesterase [candidate division KSB1 bacterium]|nr:PaaI family thioesterase [candidate division KSB1 bacterium]